MNLAQRFISRIAERFGLMLMETDKILVPILDSEEQIEIQAMGWAKACQLEFFERSDAHVPLVIRQGTQRFTCAAIHAVDLEILHEFGLALVEMWGDNDGGIEFELCRYLDREDFYRKARP
jgi:hypothetical protein